MRKNVFGGLGAVLIMLTVPGSGLQAKGATDYFGDLFMKDTKQSAEAVAYFSDTDYAVDPTIKPLLIEMLDGDNMEMKCTAISILGHRKDRDALPRITELLGSDAAPMEVRMAASDVLGNMPDESSLSVLIAACNDPSDRIWNNAINGLCTLYQEHKLSEADAQSIREELGKCLESDNTAVKINALRNIGRINEKIFIPILTELKKDFPVRTTNSSNRSNGKGSKIREEIEKALKQLEGK